MQIGKISRFVEHESPIRELYKIMLKVQSLLGIMWIFHSSIKSHGN